MSPAQMRVKVTNAYLSPNWAEKVDKMSDTQVAAIYTRLLSQKKV